MHIVPFSKRQRQALAWWVDGSPHQDKDIIVAEGAIRSGKTMSMIDSFVIWSQTNFSNQNFIIAGKTIAALKRNVIEPLKTSLTDKGISFTYRLNDNTLIIGSNTYYCFGANTENSQDSVQGLTSAGSFCDEVTLMPRGFVEQVMGRCSVEGSKYFFTLNPSNPFHWFKTEYIDKSTEKRILKLKFTMDDNPALAKEARERLERMFTGLFYQRYILGEWVQAEGVIYDMWNKKYVIDCPKERDYYDEIIASLDYGTSTVMTFALYGIKDGIYYLFKEYYWDAQKERQQKTDAEYAEDFQKFTYGYKVSKVYIDPSAASFRNTMRRLNIICKSAKNEVVNGIRTVAALMKDDKFFVDKACKATIEEFSQYVWDSKAQERGEDKPLKKNDHAMDRNRYALHSHASQGITKAIKKPQGF